MRRLAVLLATGLGLGRLPVAPATWASAATAALLFWIHPWLSLPFWILLAACLTAVALLVSGPAEKELGHDAKPIVVDEVAGMTVTMIGAPWIGSWPMAATFAVGFLLFRIFDIWKPAPVGRSQALPGAWGVVMDDLLAGVYANLVLQVLAMVGRRL